MKNSNLAGKSYRFACQWQGALTSFWRFRYHATFVQSESELRP